MTPTALASAIRDRLRAAGRVGRKPARRPSEASLIRIFSLIGAPLILVQSPGDDAARVVTPLVAGLFGVAIIQGSQLQSLMLVSPEAWFLRYLPARPSDLMRSTFGVWLRGWLWCLLVVAGLIVKHGEAPLGARFVAAGGESLFLISALILLVSFLPFERRGLLLANGGLLLVLVGVVAWFRDWRPIDPVVLRTPAPPAVAVVMGIVSLLFVRLAYGIVERRWATYLIEAEVLRTDVSPAEQTAIDAVIPGEEGEAEWSSHIPTKRRLIEQTRVPFSGVIESAVWRVLSDEERPAAVLLCGEVRGGWSRKALLTFVALAFIMLNPNLLLILLFGFQALAGSFPGWLGVIGSGFVVSPALFPVRGRVLVSSMIKVQLVRTVAVAIPLLLLGRMTDTRLWIPVVLVAAQPIAVAARVLDAARPAWFHAPVVLSAFAPLAVGITLLIQRLLEPAPMQVVWAWMAVGEISIVALAIWILERGRVDLVQKLGSAFAPPQPTH